MGNLSLSAPKSVLTSLWVILMPLVAEGQPIKVAVLAVDGCFYSCPVEASSTAAPMLFVSNDAAEEYIGAHGGLSDGARVARVNIVVPVRGWLDAISNVQKSLCEQMP